MSPMMANCDGQFDLDSIRRQISLGVHEDVSTQAYLRRVGPLCMWTAPSLPQDEIPIYML